MFTDTKTVVALTALALSMPATAIQRCKPADLTPMARAELTAVFMDDESSPAAGRSLWAYTVRVENTGRDSLTLIGRCWEVQGKGQPVEIYAGQGLVGQTPRLDPGATYEYSSWAPLSSASGLIRGHIVALDSTGRSLRIPVAEVTLRMPVHPLR
jgi:ApaG protein